MCAGIQFIKAFDSLPAAIRAKEAIQNSGGGCCDVVKKRVKIGADRPDVIGIYNNNKYY